MLMKFMLHITCPAAVIYYLSVKIELRAFAIVRPVLIICCNFMKGISNSLRQLTYRKKNIVNMVAMLCALQLSSLLV